MRATLAPLPALYPQHTSQSHAERILVAGIDVPASEPLTAPLSNPRQGQARHVPPPCFRTAQSEPEQLRMRGGAQGQPHPRPPSLTPSPFWPPGEGKKWVPPLSQPRYAYHYYLPRPRFSYTSRGQGRAWLEKPQQFPPSQPYVGTFSTIGSRWRGLRKALMTASQPLKNSPPVGESNRGDFPRARIGIHIGSIGRLGRN